MKNQHIAVAHKGAHPNQKTESFAAPTRQEAYDWLMETLGGELDESRGVYKNLGCKDEGLGCGHTATRVTHDNGQDFGYVLPSLFADSLEGLGIQA